jgi:hypothetical protein
MLSVHNINVYGPSNAVDEENDQEQRGEVEGGQQES